MLWGLQTGRHYLAAAVSAGSSRRFRSGKTRSLKRQNLELENISQTCWFDKKILFNEKEDTFQWEMIYRFIPNFAAKRAIKDILSLKGFWCPLGDTGFCRLQGIKVLWSLQFLGYFRTLSLKFQKATSKIEVVLALPCWLSQFSWDRADSGQLQFWSEPFEILNVRSSGTPETVAFTIPWYLED